MNPVLAQQRRLLAEKLQVLARIETGLRWSLERLPEVTPSAVDDPATAERMAAIVDRFCKLQDQLAGALRHAHSMSGEQQRSFHDVVTWAVTAGILPDRATWLELRSLCNQLTHEYDPASTALPELIELIRQGHETLGTSITMFRDLCARHGLI